MSFQKTKVDPELGNEIQQHLEEVGLDTPVNQNALAIDNKAKIEKIETLTREIWETLGMDLSDDSLAETPKRIAKMMVLESFWGLLPENFPKNTTIEDKMKVDEMVTVGNINVSSWCEHHGLPIMGTAYVSYIAQGKVIGLSKLARVVEYFCRRPQVQERLTSQIQESLCHMLGTNDVAVGIRATHTCMTMRGVEDRGAWTQTTKLGGSFKTDSNTRSEFLQLLKDA